MMELRRGYLSKALKDGHSKEAIFEVRPKSGEGARLEKSRETWQGQQVQSSAYLKRNVADFFFYLIF